VSGLRRHLGPIAAALLAALGMAVAIAVRPGDASVAAEAYVLFLGAIGMALLAQATSRTFAPPVASRLAVALGRRPPRKEERLPELERIERELEMATQSAYDVHFRLRPILRELASTRLATRGIQLDEPGSRAEQLLGLDAWQLVLPGVDRPANHYEPGIRLESVEDFLHALERIP
jgi:hypothetical protein